MAHVSPRLGPRLRALDTLYTACRSAHGLAHASHLDPYSAAAGTASPQRR